MVVYRGPGPWGPGKGSNLDAADFDGNTYQLITMINAKAAQGVGLTGFTVVGDQLWATLSDNSIVGPYALPVVSISFTGNWQPATQYYVNQIFTINGSTYIVMVNHTSASSFDPGANDGSGNDYYGLLLSNPVNALPIGGPAGWFLRKATSADYVVTWGDASLQADLADVVIGHPIEGEGLFYHSGVWTNAPSPAEALRFEDLTDTSIHNPANGDVPTYESGNWVNSPVSLRLSQLTDTTISAPQQGQPLSWNGTAWANVNKVDLPCGAQATVAGNLSLDRSTGEAQRIILGGSVTNLTILNWPPGGQFARLVLEIQNPNSYAFAFTGSGIFWPGGVAPSLGTQDLYIFVTFDGGATVYGCTVGQNYAPT